MRQMAGKLQLEIKTLLAQLAQRDKEPKETVTVVDEKKIIELESIIYQMRSEYQELLNREVKQVEVVKTVEVEDTQRIDTLNDHIIMLHAELDGLKKALEEKDSYTEIQVSNYQSKIA